MKDEIPGVWFVTFADGRLLSTLDRVRKQAHGMHAFGNRILIWSEKDLPEEFLVKMHDRLSPGEKKYGFWCWKPQIILRALDRMNFGDVLLYVDAGSHLNPRGLQRLCEYVRLARRRGIVAFQARSNSANSDLCGEDHFLLEKCWSKGDLIDYFGVRDNSGILDSGQYQATAFLVCKCSFTIRFFEKFMSMFYEHFELCDDTPSNSENMCGFSQHRYDQSVFSLMCKTAGIPALSMAELEPIRTYMPKGACPKDWPDKWHDLNRFPILVKRDKGQHRIVCPDWAKPFIGVNVRNVLVKWLTAAFKI